MSMSNKMRTITPNIGTTQEVWLLKIGADSTDQDVYTNGSYGHSNTLVIDSSGNYLAFGRESNPALIKSNKDAATLGNVVIDPVSPYNLTNVNYGTSIDSNDDLCHVGSVNSLNNGYVCSHDNRFNVNWARQIQGVSYTDIGLNASVIVSGNVYAVGVGDNGGTPLSAVIMKWDSSGTLQFSNTYYDTGSTNSMYLTHCLYDSGYVYGLGLQDVDGPTNFNLHLVKVSTSGTSQWSYYLGTNSTENPFSFFSDGSNNLYLGVKALFEGGIVNKVSGGATPTLDWQNEIDVDGASGYFVPSCGICDSTGDPHWVFDNGEQSDVHIIRFDAATGASEAQYTITQADSNDKFKITGMQFDNDGYMVLSGYLDDNSAGTGDDLFIMRLAGDYSTTGTFGPVTVSNTLVAVDDLTPTRTWSFAATTTIGYTSTSVTNGTNTTSPDTNPGWDTTVYEAI